jgi:hypothetical protein
MLDRQTHNNGLVPSSNRRELPIASVNGGIDATRVPDRRTLR